MKISFGNVSFIFRKMNIPSYSLGLCLFRSIPCNQSLFKAVRSICSLKFDIRKYYEGTLHYFTFNVCVWNRMPHYEISPCNVYEKWPPLQSLPFKSMFCFDFFVSCSCVRLCYIVHTIIAYPRIYRYWTSGGNNVCITLHTEFTGSQDRILHCTHYGYVGVSKSSTW